MTNTVERLAGWEFRLLGPALPSEVFPEQRDFVFGGVCICFRGGFFVRIGGAGVACCLLSAGRQLQRAGRRVDPPGRTAHRAAELLGANLRTTHRALKVLAEADVIAPTSAGTRNRIWEASAVMDLLSTLVSLKVPGPLPGSPPHPRPGE